MLGPRSAPITRRQIPGSWSRARWLLLASGPARSLLRIPEGLRRLMSALGGPDAQRSALNFPLSVENCRFFNAIAGFKGKLTGEHKSIDLRFIHKQ